MLNKYIELINNALRNEDNVIRTQAQFQLTELRHNNTQSFFSACGDLLAGNNFDDFIRQSAATLLTRSAILKNQNNCFYWDMISPDTKNKIKQSALGTLMNQNILIVKSGANVISSIVFVQVPRGQWGEIIDLLAENTQNAQFAAKNASIITIGFICQQFNFAFTELDLRVCQQLLGGILIGMRSTESSQLVETSLAALRNSICFLTQLFRQQNVRNSVFSALMGFINNQDYSNIAYQGLFQFCKVCYDFLNQFIGTLQDLIVNHIQRRNQNTILALQLVDSLGTQYLDRLDDKQNRYQANGNLNNYLLPMQNVLLPEIMRCLLIESKDDLEFVELRNSAIKTLGTLVSCGNRQCIDSIINGVAHVVKSDNLGHQQASAILLSALCQYDDKDIQYAQKYVNDAFEPVISLLSSPEQIVVINTLVGFSSIAQRFPKQFYCREKSPQIFQKLFQIFNRSNSQNIKNQVLSIFFNMTQKFQDSDNILLTQPQIFLTRLVSEYEVMIQNYYGNNISYCNHLSNIIINCMVKLEDRQIIFHMIEYLLQKYFEYNDPNNVNIRKYSKNDLEMISLSLFSLINTAILALEKFANNAHLMPNICNAVDCHLKNYGIQGEVIDVISSMAISFKMEFQRKAEQYWGTILHGLEMIDNQKCFVSALRCIGDYSRSSFARDFTGKINELMRKLIGLINQNIQRNLKIAVISSLGDITIGLGIMAEPFVGDILNICELCFAAVYELSALPSQKQYAEQLKFSLVELYACMVFAMLATGSIRKGTLNRKIVNHFQKLVIFVIKTCDPQLQPTIDYLKNAIMLLFDQITFLWQQKQLHPMLCHAMDSNQVQELVRLIKGIHDKSELNDLMKHIDTRYGVKNKLYKN